MVLSFTIKNDAAGAKRVLPSGHSRLPACSSVILLPAYIYLDIERAYQVATFANGRFPLEVDSSRDTPLGTRLHA